MTLLEELRWRQLIHNVTDENLEKVLETEKVTFYLGCDPTGDSLHVGHLEVYLLAKRLQRKGHNPILLIGGATGSIGDPRQTSERNMMDMETISHNANCLYKQVTKLFKCEMVNNYDWIKDIDVLTFLRKYGKFFNVNYMINKETVKQRLESGISYAEFSYQILQALDFEHLYREKNCTLQIGGQDQWGNITGGLELIRKMNGIDSKAYGLTAPLVLKSDGTKFGKSETGTVWLDSNKTSIYDFYQFWINTQDNDVINYLRKFTFLTRKEIEEIEDLFKKEPEKRLAQKMLAKEVTTLVHGEEGFNQAFNITNALFNNDIKSLSEEEFNILAKSINNSNKDKIIDVLVDLKLASSNREARQFITSGAVIVNDEKIIDINYTFEKEKGLYNKYFYVRRGKKNFGIVVL